MLCSYIQVREKTGARVIFPGTEDKDQEVITIIGKEESVEQAKKELEALIKNLVSSYFCLYCVCGLLGLWEGGGITVIGKEESLEKVKKELEVLIKTWSVHCLRL